MEIWLLIALVIWIGLCVPAVREIWRRLKWGRVKATVLAHKKNHGMKQDDALFIAFQAPKNNAIVHTYLPSKLPKLVLQARWPVNCAIEVQYDPLAPTIVTWPRSSRIVALCFSVFALPAFGCLLTLLWYLA